jgi:hypothetical protein
LILLDWFEDHMQMGQRFAVSTPDFAQHIKVFERQNNLQWLPSINNVPALLAPCVTHCPAVDTPRVAISASMERRVPAASASNPREQRDLGHTTRNLTRASGFMGNIAFVNNIHNSWVYDVMTLAGG